jgi:hypothetical protein
MLFRIMNDLSRRTRNDLWMKKGPRFPATPMSID